MGNYNRIINLISPTYQERSRVIKTRDSLVDSIDSSFQRDERYSHTTVIGSAATGNFLRGYRDIDALLLFHQYDLESFREGVRKIKGLEEIEFAGKKLTVEDKVNASYNHFDVSLGVVSLSNTPENSLGLDMEKHPSFTADRIKEAQKEDVLLTKQFFKNIGLYGEKLGGFTIEQMVAYFGKFEEILKNLRDRTRIYVDYSEQFNGASTPMVVTYPFCGLDNLAKRVTEDDLEKSREYAQTVLSNPELFLEDTRRVMNRDFWNKRAVKYKHSEEFGFPDIHLNHRENRILRQRIGPYGKKRVLDVGCANGYSTIAISRPGDNYVFGIDANNKAIEMANRLKGERGLEDINFEVGEMTAVPLSNNSFDIVYAKRALSNLPSRREQKKAIEELSRLTKPGGKVYVFDLFMEGYERLNNLRSLFGLEPIESPFHCIPLTEDFIKMASENGLRIIGEEDPTSSYYCMSRVIYPRILKPFGRQVHADSIPNWLFSRFPSIGNIGANKLYTFRKK